MPNRSKFNSTPPAGMLSFSLEAKNKQPLQDLVLPSFRKNKQDQENQWPEDHKNKCTSFFLVLPSDGNLTIEFACPNV